MPAMSGPPTFGAGMSPGLQRAYSAPPSSMYNPMLGTNPMMPNPMMPNPMMSNPMMPNPMMPNPMMPNPMMPNPMMGMHGYPTQLSTPMIEAQMQQIPQMLAYLNLMQQQIAAHQQMPLPGNTPPQQTQPPPTTPVTPQPQNPTGTMSPFATNTSNIQQQMAM